MGKTVNEQWRSRERWDKKVAQEMELETQEIVSGCSEEQEIDMEWEEGAEDDYMRSLEEKEQLVGSDEEEEAEGEDDESYSPFPEPRFTTGSNTFAQTMRSSSPLKPVEKKSRLGCILLIACSKARNRPTDPFLRMVNAVYLVEANHYLSTLALPLPICGALKIPEVQIVNREVSTPNQSPSSRVIGIKGRSKAEVPKPAKLQAEINYLKAEVERLKIENSHLKEEERSVEKREKARYEGELQRFTQQVTEQWRGKLDAIREELTAVKKIQEGIDLRRTESELQELDSIKILEGKLECAQSKIQQSQQRVKELETEKKNLSQSLVDATEKLKDHIASQSNTSAPLASLSLSANCRIQNFKSNEIQTQSVVSVKQAQVKLSEAGRSRLNETQIRAKPGAKFSSRIAMSISNKKDFVIANLSQKVKELNQQLKEQNDYIVNLLAVISSSSSRKPVSKK